MICLGIDVGGTGVKCVAFSESGIQMALAYEEYPIPAGTTVLPAELLWECTEAVIAECVQTLPDPSQVAAVTASSFGESFVSIDQNGQPVSDILLYFGGNETDAFDRTVKAVGAQTVTKITRLPPDASYSLSKMLLTLERTPVEKFLFIAGFVTYCLSGRTVTDEALASRSLLFDAENRCWSPVLLAAAGIAPSQLPEIVPLGTAVGTLLPSVAARLGLSASVQVVVGSHDQIVNALGAGVQNPGDCADTTGTCECITPLFSKLPESSFADCNFACVPYLAGYVTYAYNISAGSVVRWFRDTFRLSYDEMNKGCPTAPTDLILLPFLQGMGGTPDTMPSAVGQITGLTTNTTVFDLYRAVLEGLCFEMRYNLEKLASYGIAPKRLLACGGGAKSEMWLQIKADVWNRPVTRVLTEETGALGSAILGFAALTGEDCRTIAGRFAKIGETYLPIPAHREIYDKKYKTYKNLRAAYLRSTL